MLRDAVESREDRLQRRPAADSVDEAFVLHLAPVADLAMRRLRASEPPLRQEAAGDRPIGEQAQAILEAEGAHLSSRAAVEQRKANLVGDDFNAVLDENPQMRRVEIGDAKIADQPFAPQLVEFLHRVEIGGMLEAPPMELQEIDGRDAEAPQTELNADAHHVRRHRAGRRTPFGEDDRSMRAGRLAAGEAGQEPSRDQLRAAVMVSHIESVEAHAGIFEHRRGSRLGVKRLAVALHVSDLPEPGYDAANVEFRRERDAIGRVGHGRPQSRK